ncbi:hypothetical protein Peur_027221 [Populus x canadensis]
MRATSPCSNYKNCKLAIGGSKRPVSVTTAISITECRGWHKDRGRGDSSNCDIACNSKPCWNLIFEKELGLGRGTFRNREATSCISPLKLKKQCSECSA